MDPNLLHLIGKFCFEAPGASNGEKRQGVTNSPPPSLVWSLQNLGPVWIELKGTSYKSILFRCLASSGIVKRTVSQLCLYNHEKQTSHFQRGPIFL